MSTEKEYIISIDEFKQRLSIAQKETWEAIKERDRILGETLIYRNGLNILKEETKRKEIEKEWIESEIESLRKSLEESRTNYLVITERERKEIEELNTEIEEKKSISSKFTIKREELETLEKNVSNKHYELKRLQQEVYNESQNIEKHHKTQENEEIGIQVRKSEIKERENYLNQKQISLEEKEKELERKEKRLNNLKQEIIWERQQ